MGYKILEENSKEVLSVEVNKHIEKGWLPQGGVSIMRKQYHQVYFFQAMIKK